MAAKSSNPENLPATIEAEKPKKSGRKTGNGPGYGGPAKGYVYKPAKAFEVGNKYGAIPPDEERIKLRKQRVWELENVLYDAATNGQHEVNRIQAASRLLDRLDGLPIARTELRVTTDVTQLSDEELLRLANAKPD